MDIKLDTILKKLFTKCEKLHNLHNKKELRGLNLIYHFTNASSFENIIKNRYLKFTDYRTLNDKLEIKYAQEIIIHAIDKSKLEFKSALNFIFNNFFNLMDNDNLFNIYICSFSKTFANLA